MGLFASFFGSGCKQSAPPPPSGVQQLQTSQRLADVAFFALDHGIYSIQDGEGPLIPFVVSEQAGGKRTLSRYMADKLEDSVAQARLAVSQLPADVTCYAIAYDGYITVKGTKYDAIFVEASERGRPRAVLLAQRYIPKTGQQSFQRVGNAAFVGEEDSRFR